MQGLKLDSGSNWNRLSNSNEPYSWGRRRGAPSWEKIAKTWSWKWTQLCYNMPTDKLTGVWISWPRWEEIKEKEKLWCLFLWRSWSRTWELIFKECLLNMCFVAVVLLFLFPPKKRLRRRSPVNMTPRVSSLHFTCHLKPISPNFYVSLCATRKRFFCYFITFFFYTSKALNLDTNRINFSKLKEFKVLIILSGTRELISSSYSSKIIFNFIRMFVEVLRHEFAQMHFVPINIFCTFKLRVLFKMHSCISLGFFILFWALFVSGKYADQIHCIEWLCFGSPLIKFPQMSTRPRI